MELLKDKHIVITGGAKGIGKASAEIFLREGNKVTILDIDDTANCGEEHKNNFLFCHADVSREGQVKEGMRLAVQRFGEIDALVNNAGIVRYATVTELSEETWDLVMGVNLKSAFLCAKHAIPSMLKKGKGVVINVASVQAFITQNRVAAYTASKSALLGLTRSIAVDYAPNIRCVAVCPGSVDTPMLRNAFQESPDPEDVYRECVDMHLVKKIASPEEVGELIAFLSSDKASFITGQAYRIDGGLGIAIGGSKRS